VECMEERIAHHDPLPSGTIQPHKLKCSTNTFQMPSLTNREAYDTGQGGCGGWVIGTEE
jgi:hypothetical protein